MVTRATVAAESPLGARTTITDDRGSYSFGDLPAGKYRIHAHAPGLTGSGTAEIQPGQSIEVSIQLTLEAVSDSVTVNGSADAVISEDAEQQNAVTRSTLLNAPTKDDRVDTLLPLVPGVVRGPDGLINMKGARSSQGGSLVNTASSVDPVTGNPAMSLPVDVVESATVIANPYDPEYGRLEPSGSGREDRDGAEPVRQIPPVAPKPLSTAKEERG